MLACGPQRMAPAEPLCPNARTGQSKQQEAKYSRQVSSQMIPWEAKGHGAFQSHLGPRFAKPRFPLSRPFLTEGASESPENALVSDTRTLALAGVRRFLCHK